MRAINMFIHRMFPTFVVYLIFGASSVWAQNRLDQYSGEILSQRTQNRRVYTVKTCYEILDAETSETSINEREEQVVEVGSGICYKDPDGVWQPSQIQWQETTDGFIIDKAAYELKVGTTLGAWMEYTEKEKKAKLRPVKIEASGVEETRTLAVINTEVQGTISTDDSNKLIFKNAFAEGIDLEIEAKLNGYHQNVIFRRHPLGSASVEQTVNQIAIITEILFEEDEELLEFAVDDKESACCLSVLSNFNAQRKNLHVCIKKTKDDIEKAKGWFRFADSKIFDKKGIKFSTVSADKQIIKERERLYLVESLERNYFDEANYPVVWDYHVIGGSLGADEQIWFANETYYVSSDLTVGYGDNLLIEPGTVVKFNDNTRIETTGYSNLYAIGEPLLPIVFTSKHDNLCGATITGSTGNPAQGDYEGLFISSQVVKFCRIQYAQYGINAQGYLYIDHNIISECQKGIYTISSINLYLRNNLIVNCDYGLYADYQGSTAVWYVDNCTLDNHTSAGLSASTYGSFTVKNSLFTNCDTGVIASSSNITADHCGYALNTTNYTGPFTGGTDAVYLGNNNPYESALTHLGEHYLNDDASAGALLMNAGDGTVDSFYYYPGGETAWAVRHVPAERCYTSTTTVSGVWEPHVDTCDQDNLAIGYHHPRIDYYVKPGCISLSGKLTVNAGTTVIGGGGYGSLIAGQGVNFVSKGLQSEDRSIDYVRYVSLNSASALPTPPISRGGTYMGVSLSQGSTYEIQFTKFEDIYHALSISYSTGICRNSIFSLNYEGATLNSCENYLFQNCLFKNNDTGLVDFSGYGTIEFCTFANNPVGLHITYFNNGEMTIRNNLFHYEQDHTVWAVQKNGGADVDEYNNAFYNIDYPYADYSGTPITSLDSSDFTEPHIAGTRDLSGDPLFNSYYFQSFFNQRYCLSSSTPLVNGGYDPSASGMPQFTTQADFTPDTTPVDIGYHFPLTIDTDGDGFYDYEELWLGTNPNGATIWYVNAAASGGNGLSWSGAFKYVQDAINNELLVKGDQIWVAGGTYYPDEGEGQIANDRSSAFQLVEGVALYGGFAGTETALEQRDWTAHETILSGDIGITDNCYHVVIGADDATLDGFTITGGFADGSGNDGCGGGMLTVGVSPTVIHCVFKNNVALYGGGIYIDGDTHSPHILDCTLQNNTATQSGGGIYIVSGTPVIAICNVQDNTATGNGGGILNLSSNVQISYCSFIHNTGYPASAVATSGFNTSLSFCSFTNNYGTNLNHATVSIGGNYTYVGHNSFENNSCRALLISGTRSKIDACTFTSNQGGGGAAIRVVGPITNGDVEINNCHFVENYAANNKGAGAIYLTNCGVTKTCKVDRCIFYNNSSSSSDDSITNGGGGAVYCYNTKMQLNNSLFVSNHFASGANGYGGAICLFDSNVSNIVNCTFYGNNSYYGGVVWAHANQIACNTTLTNCILWNNASTINGHEVCCIGVSTSYKATATLKYCDIQNTTNWMYQNTYGIVNYTPSSTYYNIYDNPTFVNTGNPKGSDNQWSTGDDGFMIQSTSLCKNLGYNVTSYPDYITVDITGNSRQVNNIVDIGAYECRN